MIPQFFWHACVLLHIKKIEFHASSSSIFFVDESWMVSNASLDDLCSCERFAHLLSQPNLKSLSKSKHVFGSIPTSKFVDWAIWFNKINNVACEK